MKIFFYKKMVKKLEKRLTWENACDIVFERDKI